MSLVFHIALTANRLEEGENTDIETSTGGQFSIAKHDNTVWIDPKNDQAKKEVEDATKD